MSFFLVRLRHLGGFLCCELAGLLNFKVSTFFRFTIHYPVWNLILFSDRLFMTFAECFYVEKVLL